jgi:hypothetical protein
MLKLFETGRSHMALLMRLPGSNALIAAVSGVITCYSPEAVIMTSVDFAPQRIKALSHSIHKRSQQLLSLCHVFDQCVGLRSAWQAAYIGLYSQPLLPCYVAAERVRNCCLCMFKCCLRSVLMQPTGRPELEV